MQPFSSKQHDPKLGIKVAFFGFIGMVTTALLAFLGLSIGFAIPLGFVAWVVLVIGIVIQELIRRGKWEEH